MGFFSRLLKVLKVTGKVAETVGPVALGAVNPAAGAIAEAGVKVLEEETGQQTTSPQLPKGKTK